MAISQDSIRFIADSLRIDLLEQQVSLMEAHYSALQGTIMWAVGGVLALALLVAGVNVFLNTRSYDRDKNSMQRDLESQMNAKISELTFDMSVGFDTKSKEFETSNLSRFELIRKEFDHKIESMSKRISREIGRINLASTLSAAEGYATSGRVDLALWKYAQAIEETLSASAGRFEQEQIIGKIDSLLKGSQSFQLRPDTSARLNNALGMVDSEFSSEADVLRDIMKRIRIGD